MTNLIRIAAYLSVATILLLGPPAAVAAPKVQVCHIPPGNPDNFHTIKISQNALAAHLRHGDLAGSCFANAPTICNDGNACTIDAIDPATGQCATDHPPVDCDDGDLCTTDTCDPVDGCQSTPVTCDDGDLCTVDACNPFDGQCTATPLDCGPLGACVSDTGQCEFPCDGITCEPIDQCHTAGACVLPGTCTAGVLVDPGTPCNDGNPATSADQCDAQGICAGQPDLVVLSLSTELTAIEENGGPVAISVTLSNPVPYSVSFTLAFAGTAVPFADYTVSGFGGTIPTGELSTDIELQPINDAVYTGDKIVTATIDSTQPPDVVADSQSVSITILEDELGCNDLSVPASSLACTAEDRGPGYPDVVNEIWICRGTISDVTPYELVSVPCADAGEHIGIAVGGGHPSIWPNTVGFGGFLYDCACAVSQ